MKIFEKPRNILHILEKSGFEAYLVGGCVRDFLLNRPIHDWDMTTSATPEEMMALFPKTIPTGIQHGTVTILQDGESFEVTTFRSDGTYQDNRHPDGVHFVKSLDEDLSRRDFTINAMAMDCRGNLTDLWGGQTDLNAKVIRTVGNPQKRFQEDALRMVRAYRFSAQLGFSLDADTADAILPLAPLCNNLSPERIRDEVEKTLLSPLPTTLNTMIAIGLLDPYFPQIPLDFPTGSTRLCRWAQVVSQIPNLDLKKLRLDNKTIKIATAVSNAPPIKTLVDFKTFLWKNGLEAGKVLGEVTNTQDLLDIILQENHCYSLPQLAVNGRDFPHLSGKILGQTLTRLLTHVIEHPDDNTYEILRNLPQ